MNRFPEIHTSPSKIFRHLLDILDALGQNVLVVSNDEYAKLLAQTIKAMEDRLTDLHARREQLAAELLELDNAIALATEDIKAATAIWGRSSFGAQAIGETKPLLNVTGFTEAIEYVLRTLSTKLSPTEIRDKLADWGYDLEKYETDVVASIHTVLRRLQKRGKVQEFQDGDRRKSYQWIKKA